MSDMSAAVVLRLVDDITGPAKNATKSVENMLKTFKAFKNMKMSAGGINKSFADITKGATKATKATKDLKSTFSRPPANGFARSSASITNIAKAADRATASVRGLQRRLSAGGSFNGGGGFGGRRGGGHNGRERGGGGHGWGSAFRHVGAYEVAHHGMHAAKEALKTGMEQAFELQHVKAMLAIQGENSDSINAVVARARGMAKAIPQFSTAQHAAAIAELRPAMIGGLKEAMHLAPDFQRAVGVLEAVKSTNKKFSGIDSHGEALDLARAMELKGVMGDGDKTIRSYMNGMTKAIVAFNGQITAGDFHAAIKYGRGASRGWSEQFVEQYLPTIMNDIKSKGGTATGAGNALASFSRTVVDRVMKASAVEEWSGLGLVKKGFLNRDKKGKPVSIKQGGIEGWETAISNPYEWFQTYFMPAMRKKNGGKDPKESQIISELGSLFGNRIAQMLATIMAVQKAQLEKDAQNVRDAMGMDGLAKLYKMDSTTRIQVLSAAFKDLGEAIGEIATPGVMRGLKGLIDWAHRTSESIRQTPYMKALGSYFDAAVAGLFGQRMGRRQLAKGKNRDYYNAGKFLGEGWGKFTAYVGRMAKFWEEVGVVRWAMRGLGGIFYALGASGNFLVGVFERIRDIDFNSVFKAVGDKLEAAGQTLVNAFESIIGWFRAKFAFMFPAAAAPPKAVTPPLPNNPLGGGVGGLRAKRPPPYGGLVDTFSPKGAFGLSGVENIGSKAIAPIASAVGSVTPIFAVAGQSAMQALAGGLQAGAGQAKTEMSALMGALAGIASQGVTIPVNLDTAGAEAKLSALVSRTSSLGTGGASRGQFSKSLHDLGG